MDDPKIMTDSYLAAFVTSVFSMFNEPALGNQMIYFVTSLVFFIVMIVEHSKIKKKISWLYRGKRDRIQKIQKGDKMGLQEITFIAFAMLAVYITFFRKNNNSHKHA